MHNLQEIKCTFFNFFLRLDQATGSCGTGEQLYWLQRRAWQMSGCQAPLSPGRRVQDDPDLQPSQARSRTIVLVISRLFQARDAAAPGSVAQSRTIILVPGVPITWNPDNPNNLVQTPVLSTPTPILQSRTISIKARGGSPIPPR